MTFLDSPPGAVAYILKMFPRFSETFILSEILELERRGMELRIFSLKHPNDGRFHADAARVRTPVTYLPPIRLANMRAFLAPHWRLFNANRRRYLRTFALAARRLRWAPIKRFLQAGYIAPVLREAGITHLHAHFASSATSVAYYIHQLTGASYSFTAHAKDIYIESVAEDVLRRKLNCARFVVTVSDHNQAHLSTIAEGARIARIYNGLDLDQFSPNGFHPDSPPLVLAVGRLVEKKGFADLIRACAVLRDQEVAFRCRIVGAGSEEPTLRALVADLGLIDLVELPGLLPREELIQLYPRAGVVVAPCVIGADGNRDGLPTVLIEAMALGVPVVSTGVTGIPELVQDGMTGQLVNGNDPAGLAAAIRRSLEDRPRAQEMARAGRRLVEAKFDLRRNVAQLHTLLTDASRRP